METTRAGVIDVGPVFSPQERSFLVACLMPCKGVKSASDPRNQHASGPAMDEQELKTVIDNQGNAHVEKGPLSILRRPRTGGFLAGAG